MNSPKESCGAFTTEDYCSLVRLAIKQYRQASYRRIPWGEPFILWRHDVDVSINRALVLARLESELGLNATYFLNPHSEYYNLFQADQVALVREIIALGHDIGLHLDAGFYGDVEERGLHELVIREARCLEKFFGIRPAAFSFHNPLASHLQFENEFYGGLINCYSRQFKSEVSYCSDSNGYWRFRRLHDVLSQATDICLQVLTHPEWWQDSPMPPRQRICRSVYGRARATIAGYDAVMVSHDRDNHSGAAGSIGFLRDVLPDRYALLDFLWMSGEMATLFVELWRLHESQINKLCKVVLHKEWQVPACEVNAFFDSPTLAIDGWRLFVGVFGQSWQDVSGIGDNAYAEWVSLRNQLVHGRGATSKQLLEEGSVFLCGIIASLAVWGKAQPIGYDGLAHLGSIGLPAFKTADGGLTDRLEELADEMPKLPKKKWEHFKVEMAEVGTGGTAA
jgi:hypothetical protein